MNFKDVFSGEETLIRNERVFSPEYIPERFGHRDSQLKTLSLHIRPALRGGLPVNTLITGPCGTGKTTSAKLIFTQVEEATEKIACVYVNCQLNYTPFSIFSLVSRRLTGHMPPETGVPLTKLQDSIARRLASEKKCLILALDDIDYLFLHEHAEKILYDILRMHEKYAGLTTAIFGITSSPDFRFQLAAKVATVFMPKEVHFPPYTREQTRDILKDRMVEGLVSGCLPHELFEYVVEKTHEAGDLRAGIAMLHRSALEAEGEDSKKIEKRHIDAAFRSDASLAHTISSLSEEERQLLSILSQKGGVSFSGELFKAFLEKTGHKEKLFSQIIRRLETLRLIDTSYRKGAGRSRDIVLRLDGEEVRKALGEGPS